MTDKSSPLMARFSAPDLSPVLEPQAFSASADTGSLSAPVKPASSSGRLAACCSSLGFGLTCLVLAAAAIALFGLSLYLWPSYPAVGPGCGSNVNGYEDACMYPQYPGAFGCVFLFDTVGDTCENICTSAAVAGFTPFRFSFAIIGGTSGGPFFASCGYPATNTNWRLPLASVSALLCFTTFFAACRKSSKIWMGLHAALNILGGVLFFGVMCLDAIATQKGATACSTRFSEFALSVYQTTSDWKCDSTFYVVVALLDAALSVGLLLLGAMSFSRMRAL